MINLYLTIFKIFNIKYLIIELRMNLHIYESFITRTTILV